MARSFPSLPSYSSVPQGGTEQMQFLAHSISANWQDCIELLFATYGAAQGTQTSLFTSICGCS